MSNNPIVTIQGDHPTTNTLIIAEHFDKSHKNVLQSLRALMDDCTEEFSQLNFQPAPYYDAQGKQRTMYSLTRDGFMLLSMGFTGTNATRLKIAFIEEFNRMEAALYQPAQRPGQVEEVQARRTREELLKVHTAWAAIIRYRDKGLTIREIGMLTWRSETTVRKDLKRMAACGIIQYAVNPLLSAAGKRGNQKRLSLMGGNQNVH